ncbi:MAG TPA: carbonic anhydrase [Mycobacteriales bacterium]|jgi:carbonic anhydrase|nr:carbonic anhydrase [Mycobacteriales bacterium]
MTEISRLVAANRAYAAGRASVPDKRPSRRLAVLTCMDTRIDVLAALGLRPGEAHVLRNAGARVTEDVLRGLALSSHALGTEHVVVMQHTDCGLYGATDDELRATTGAPIPFLPIHDHAEALRHDVALLAATPYLDTVRSVGGLLFDVERGEVDVVVEWARED